MMRPVSLHTRTSAVLFVGLLGSACTARTRPAPVPRAYLFQKGPYQAVYGPDGFVLRLLYDSNGDGVADVVNVYRSGGRLRQVESDINLDGTVDRWERYNDQDALDSVATARRQSGTPDLWDYFDRAGTLVRREADDRGDGRVHRVERYVAGRLISVELDTDGDTRADRWQTWSNGRLTEETLDTDGDSVPDRRLIYGGDGQLLRLEKLR
jgi:hypothetical protein